MTGGADAPCRVNSLPGELREYLRQISRSEPAALAALRERTAALPFVGVMQGSPAVAQLLQFLIRLTGARRILELGAFTGCTTLSMALALPAGGRIVAIERDERWPAVGREFWDRSGCADRIDLRVGDATGVLDRLIADGLAGSFDLTFIDANKDGYEAYYERALVLLRPDGILVFDNVLFGGLVHPDWTEARIRAEHRSGPRFMQDLYVAYAAGLRRLNERLAADERVDLAVLPLHDGVTLARRRNG